MTITKAKNGYSWDCSDQTIIVFIKHYDASGVYIGQTQENMIDQSPPVFFFRPEIIDGLPCVNGVPVPALTKEQMASAE